MLSISKQDRNDLDLEEQLERRKKIITKQIHILAQNGIQAGSFPKDTQQLFIKIFQTEVLKEYRVPTLTELIGYSNALIRDLFLEMDLSEIPIPSEVMTLIQEEKTKK